MVASTSLWHNTVEDVLGNMCLTKTGFEGGCLSSASDKGAEDRWGKSGLTKRLKKKLRMKKRMIGIQFVFLVAFVWVWIWCPVLTQTAHPALCQPCWFPDSLQQWVIHCHKPPTCCYQNTVEAPGLLWMCNKPLLLEDNGMKAREKAVSTEVQPFGF